MWRLWRVICTYDGASTCAPGRNYGWPIVSFGRDYPGPRTSDHPTREGMESPLVVWIPSIGTSGMAVYTGDPFPRWKGNVFVGGMQAGKSYGRNSRLTLTMRARPASAGKRRASVSLSSL